VTTAPRRSQADAFLVRALRAVPRLGPVVLLLSPDLDVLRQAPQTQEYLRVLVPPAAGQPPVPASAYNAAAQLLATEAGVDANPPWARVHLPDGLWLTLHAARIGAVESGRERDIAVTIEQTSPPERVDPFARAFGFTARESEPGSSRAGCSFPGTPSRTISSRSSRKPPRTTAWPPDFRVSWSWS
jgi:hypothetical protein